MSTKLLNNKNVEKSFGYLLDSLSEKESSVLQRRVWYNTEKETLQNIGNSFKPQITRERVRQIEETSIKKIWRIIKSSLLNSIQETAQKYIKLHGWLMAQDKLTNILIKELKLESNVNWWILEVVIQSNFDIKKSKQKLWCEIYYMLPSTNKQLVWIIHKEALRILRRRKKVIEKTALYETIAGNLDTKEELSIILIDSIVDLFDDIVFWEENLVWLTRWKILNPKTLKDKAIYVLKRDKVPMHFVDLSNKITEMQWKSVKVNTIHNELIRNEEFVLIGRWIYALKEWGFIPGTVQDVIIAVLKKKWEPMNTEDITKEVLKTRNVKQTTIYMNLQNKKVIKRVWRNYYQAI